MPRLPMRQFDLQRPVSPSECQVYTLGCIPSQRRTRCLTNTIPSSLIVATPYVPVQVPHLWLSCCCKLRHTVPLWYPRCAVHSLTVQLHHLIPAWSSVACLAMCQVRIIQVENPRSVLILHSTQDPLDASQVALPRRQVP